MPFEPDYDAGNNLIYGGFALPGTAKSAPGWRIFKLVWSPTFGVLWADGNNLLDNVYDNRASLSYSANASLSVEKAGVLRFTPAGTRPGTAFDAGFSPIPDESILWLDSSPMRRVTTSPVGNEWRVTGGAIETGDDVGAEPDHWFELEVPLW
jgi:hypothetical protein